MADVPCNGCTACCRSGLLVPVEEIELVEGLSVDTVKVYDKDNPDVWAWKKYLKQIDGRCVHLNADGCSVYSIRPRTCREFDCRVRDFSRYPDIAKAAQERT